MQMSFETKILCFQLTKILHNLVSTQQGLVDKLKERYRKIV